MSSAVSEIPPLPADQILAHFQRRLALETDCADVHDAWRRGAMDFVLIDVRGRSSFARRHLPGAINIPHRDLTERRLAAWPAGTLFVVYCAGPHCNGADRAALRLAGLGRPVKVMPGGVTGWADEGFAFVEDSAEPAADAQS